MAYYKVVIPHGHLGIGKEVSLTLFFQAKNIIEALDKIKRQPTAKVNKKNRCYGKKSNKSSYYLKNKNFSIVEITKEQYRKAIDEQEGDFLRKKYFNRPKK